MLPLLATSVLGVAVGAYRLRRLAVHA
jgi:hypothetical protein